MSSSSHHFSPWFPRLPHLNKSHLHPPVAPPRNVEDLLVSSFHSSSESVRRSCLAHPQSLSWSGPLSPTPSPLTIAQATLSFGSGPLLPLGEGSSSPWPHSIQRKCDTCIKPSMVPHWTAHTALCGLALAFLPAPLFVSGPLPSSSHNPWLLPSRLLHWFNDGYSVSGNCPRHRDCVNKYLLWLLNLLLCARTWSEPKKVPARQELSVWWMTRMCIQRLFTIWCGRCDPEGKPTLGPEEA